MFGFLSYSNSLAETHPQTKGKIHMDVLVAYLHSFQK